MPYAITEFAGPDHEKVIEMLKGTPFGDGYYNGKGIPRPSDVYICHVSEKTGNMSFYFNMTWAPLTYPFDNLAKAHPELRFIVKYCDEDYNCGDRGAIGYAEGVRVLDRDLTREEISSMMGVPIEAVVTEGLI